MKVRIQKFLSEAGISSRRGAEQLIADGKVAVNGRTLSEPGVKIDPGVDKVTVGGKPVDKPEYGLLLFHKPTKVVSTLSDPQGRPCLQDYVGDQYPGFAPAGRLDFMTSGLLVFSNDGDLINWLLHPRYEHPRVYQALVNGIPSNKTLSQIATGIELDDGEARADITPIELRNKTAMLEITVREGRNRLVRRLMKRAGHEVLELHRLSHGPLELGSLPLEDFKLLPKKVYKRLKRQASEEIAAAE